MGILKCNKLKWDKRCIIAHIIFVILGIICGIVLYNLNKYSNYIYEFADIYVFYVFNFKNGTLFVSHLVTELFYLYIVFLLAYFTKLKFLVFPLIFLRTTVFVLYTIVLFALCAADGIVVAIFVFIPAFLCSLVLLVFICEQCKVICSPYCFLAPAVFALLSSLLFLLLINVLFRVVIVIV